MARRRHKPPPFASEVELCSAFIERARAAGWRAYPETSGYDIVLAREHDGRIRTIGVEAKLRPTVELFVQAADHRAAKTGAEWEAVLLPVVDYDARRLAHHLGLTIFEVDSPRPRPSFDPTTEDLAGWFLVERGTPGTRSPPWLPPFEPSVAAGSKAPLRMTPWKYAALRICARLELRGYLTRSDFEAEHIDMKRWVSAGWISRDGCIGKLLRYIRNPNAERVCATAPDRWQPEDARAVLEIVRAEGVVVTPGDLSSVGRHVPQAGSLRARGRRRAASLSPTE